MNEDLSNLVTTKATSLEAVFDVLRTEPLSNQEEMDAFYREMKDIRVKDIRGLLRTQLNRNVRRAPYKVFLMGASGVGKSTELRRLALEIADTHVPVWLDARTDIDRTQFKPYHIILVIANAVWKELTKRNLQGDVSEIVLEKIAAWYDTTQRSTVTTAAAKAEVKVGVGAKDDSFWSKVTGFFAAASAEASVARNTDTKVEELRMSTLAELLDPARQFFVDATLALRDHEEKEWLVVFESFDKQDVDYASNIELFLKNPAVFEGLSINAIFTIPRSITYSSGAAKLPILSANPYIIPETPVYTADLEPNHTGRNAIRSILDKRVDLDLFHPKALDSFIVASGGDIRRLFTMVTEAANISLLQNEPQISPEVAETVLNQHRLEFRNALAVSPGEGEITVRQKIDKLAALYKRDPEAEIPDRVLGELIDARAVQEFNGNFWLGVAPLMVDELNRLRAIDPPGEAPGGTR